VAAALTAAAACAACPVPEWRPQADVVTAMGDLERLAQFNDATTPAVTRVLFTDADMRARDFLKTLMVEAGLQVREDGMGNIFGRWQGAQPELPPVVTGSHMDAVPLSGRFDGTIGVLGAVEAVRALKRAGYTPQRSIDVLMFTSEEPTRFGLGCIGSRAMAGMLPYNFIDTLESNYPPGNADTFLEAAHAAGVGEQFKSHEQMLLDARIRKGDVHAFVELHIEQGPNLERHSVDIGVVTDIAGPATLAVRFKGNGGHAGGLLMPDRRDAGLAAAEFMLHVEQVVLGAGSIDAVGTTGLVQLEPGAVNSVPREAYVEVDLRDIDGDRRDMLLDTIEASARHVSRERRVAVEMRVLNADYPADCAPLVEDSVEWAAQALGLSHERMVSRAYHDSLFMAKVAPTGMIFIPCKDGVSHRPDEWISDKWYKQGIEALALTLARLSGLPGCDGDAAAQGSRDEL